MLTRIATTILLTLLLPLTGAALAGIAIGPFLEMPPEGMARDYPGFSWTAFLGIWLLFAGLLVGWLGGCPQRTGTGTRASASPTRGNFPRWGWVGVGLCLVFWVVAWTPTETEWIRRYTFPPLWLGYIITVNALMVWRTGRCPLTGTTGFFLLLFPASAAFWWLFEYLNRFVNNWVYLHASEVTALEYWTHATLSFSTVLPAVYSTYRLLRSLQPLQNRLARGPQLGLPSPRWPGLLLLLLSGGALAAVGIAPDYLFPFLWIGPLGLWTGLELFTRQRSPWPELRRGDWRNFLSWALAALICGFFWEMWNFHALPKWIYQIPWFERFYLFEMPISGYLGYLPFGLECGIVVMVLRAAYIRARRPTKPHGNRSTKAPAR